MDNARIHYSAIADAGLGCRLAHNSPNIAESILYKPRKRHPDLIRCWSEHAYYQATSISFYFGSSLFCAYSTDSLNYGRGGSWVGHHCFLCSGARDGIAKIGPLSNGISA
jgi:hypothetical protein